MIAMTAPPINIVVPTVVRTVYWYSQDAAVYGGVVQM